MRRLVPDILAYGIFCAGVGFTWSYWYMDNAAHIQKIQNCLDKHSDISYKGAVKLCKKEIR